MKRINREENNPRTDVKKRCANYQAGYICLGVIIARDLSLYFDPELAGEKCPVVEGNECYYYSETVNPEGSEE